MKARQAKALWCTATIILGGCMGEGINEMPQQPEVISQARVDQLRPTTLAVITDQTVDANSFGLVGDGQTLNTEAFKAAFGTGGRTVLVAPGDYVTASLSIPSNTILRLAPGVTIRDAGVLGPNERLLNVFSDHVHISGLGARVLANRNSYTTGEQRHGVYVFGARNVTIEGLESSGHGGDGFYVGGPPGTPASDISITGCSADNNRRQGLSITSATHVFVADCEFTTTRGTAPEFGIDLEPNATIDLIREITIVRPRTSGNFGGGILISLEKLSPSGQPATITIIDHSSIRERVERKATGVRDTVDLIRYAESR